MRRNIVMYGDVEKKKLELFLKVTKGFENVLNEIRVEMNNWQELPPLLHSLIQSGIYKHIYIHRLQHVYAMYWIVFHASIPVAMCMCMCVYIVWMITWVQYWLNSAPPHLPSIKKMVE